MNISTHNFLLFRAFSFGFIVLVCLSYVSMSTNAQSKEFRWDYIGEDMDGRKFYIDAISFDKINFRKQIRDFWLKIKFTDNSYHLYHQRWDCRRGQSKALSYVAYSVRDSVLDRKNYPNDQWTTPPPDSIGETIQSKICSVQKLGNKSDSNPQRKPEKDNFENINDENAKMVRVIVRKANVRDRPSMDSEILNTVENGTFFQLVNPSSVRGWFEVRFTRTTTAWIHGNTIKFVEIESDDN